MKIPLLIVIGVLIVLGLIIYIIVVPHPTVSISNNLKATIFTSNSPKTDNTDTMNVHITDQKEGSGEAAKQGDTLSVLYTGTLEDGTVFDASKLHGNQPFSFTLGAGEVIQGWDEGLVGVKAGGKRRLVIPPQLGYGARAIGSIPPNATLIFDIEVVGIE